MLSSDYFDLCGNLQSFIICYQYFQYIYNICHTTSVSDVPIGC